MGATGAGDKGQKRISDSEKTFGIRNARQLDENTNPAGAKFDQNGERIVISASSDEGKDIVFQFKLLKNDKMKITAYDPNIPNRGKVSVSSDRPSLDAVMTNPKSTPTDKRNAMLIRDMFQRTDSGVKESSLGRIANELKKKARKKGQKA